MGFNPNKNAETHSAAEDSCVIIANEKITDILNLVFFEEDESEPEKYPEEDLIQKLHENLLEFARNEKIRIPYYQITVVVHRILENTRNYDDLKSSRVDDGRQRLTKISDSESAKGDPDLGKLIIKLLDHIDLAALQFESIDRKVQSVSDRIEEKAEELRKDSELIGEKAEKIRIDSASIEEKMEETEAAIKELKDSIYSQIIAIVAIFTGIAFVLFGGVSALSGIKDAVQTNGTAFLRVLSYASVIGVFVIGAVLLFFRFVLVLTQKPVSSKEWTIKSGMITFWVLVGLAVSLATASVVLHFTADKSDNFDSATMNKIELRVESEKSLLVQEKLATDYL